MATIAAGGHSNKPTMPHTIAAMAPPSVWGGPAAPYMGPTPGGIGGGGGGMFVIGRKR
jgi:hypothetical protein